MKKVFILAGEASGDLVAAWLLNNHKNVLLKGPVHFVGVGGDAMKAAGVELVDSYDSLNVVGFIEIFRKLPTLVFKMWRLVRAIKQGEFDHVILVDFPGFNIRLATLLKRRIPGVRITYLIPPQLWCWGAWRLKALKKNFDDLIVMFPFEVSWYRQRGVTATYLGNPVAERVLPLFDKAAERKLRIGVFVGSRRQEIISFSQLIVDVLVQLKKKYSVLEIFVFCAPGVQQDFLMSFFEPLKTGIYFVDPTQRYDLVQTCAVVLAKAGTITLELALLRIPTVIFYKAHWFTYWLAKKLVSIDKIGLPNLLVSGLEIVPEFVQDKCTSVELVAACRKYLNLFLFDQVEYQKKCDELSIIKKLLTTTES